MKNVTFLKRNLIAHRGLYDNQHGIPENSIHSFEEAIKFGYIIELDVHLTKDNQVIVFHDDNLKRMTGINQSIKNTNYNEIKQLKLLDTNYHIPLLQEVLRIVQNKVPILIELKYDTKVGLLEKEVLTLIKNYPGQIAIHSFNPLSIYWFKKHAPTFARGQISYDFKDSSMCNVIRLLLKNMIFNILTKPEFISYGISSLPNKRIEKLRKQKIILGWTVKTEKEYNKYKPYCDNFICENMNKWKK